MFCITLKEKRTSFPESQRGAREKTNWTNQHKATHKNAEVNRRTNPGSIVSNANAIHTDCAACRYSIYISCLSMAGNISSGNCIPWSAYITEMIFGFCLSLLVSSELRTEREDSFMWSWFVQFGKKRSTRPKSRLPTSKTKNLDQNDFFLTDEENTIFGMTTFLDKNCQHCLSTDEYNGTTAI